MDDILSLNSSTNTTDYNCAGFALGTFKWYEPQSWDILSDFKVNEMFEGSVADLLEDFPNLAAIDKLEDAPEETDVVGFRISTRDTLRAPDDEMVEWNNMVEREEVWDFHFILRTKGKWYHKAGARDIAEFTGSLDEKDEWPADRYNYYGKIAWFTRTGVAA